MESASTSRLERHSASSAYLSADVRARPNLTIRHSVRAHRVSFDGQKRATGGVYSRAGATERAAARREVLLCAGAIGSPHLLQLSGVGPARVLEARGAAGQHRLGGVRVGRGRGLPELLALI